MVEEEKEERSKSTTSTQTDPVHVAPTNEDRPKRQTPSIFHINFNMNQEYSSVEYAQRDISVSCAFMIFGVFCLMLSYLFRGELTEKSLDEP